MNNFPISTAQIAEGMNNASSALSAAGNTFDQSVALLTAANTTLQNAAKASTGLRTIAARIRNTSTELEELGEDMTKSKYEEVVKALTDANVALRETNGEYRSTYDILKDIADVWDTLSNDRQAALTTALAGTRQQAVFLSIIGQFKEASGAMDAMATSAGALNKAYDVIEETAQFKINQFKAAFQEMAQTIFKSDWIGQAVDSARLLLEMVNNILTPLAKLINLIGGMKTMLPIILATLIQIKVVRVARSIEMSNARVAALTASLLREKTVTDTLAGSIGVLTLKERQQVAANIQAAVAAKTLTAEEGKQIITALGLKSANTGLAASFKSLEASIPVWGWIALGISVVLEIVMAITNNLGSAASGFEDLQQRIKQLDSEIKQISDDYRNLKKSADDVIPRFVELAKGVDKFGNNATLTNEEYAEFLELNNKIADMFPQLNLGMDESGNAMLALSYSADTLKKSLEELLEVQRQQANEALAAKMPEYLKDIQGIADKYQQDIDNLNTAISRINAGRKTFTAQAKNSNMVGDTDFYQTSSNLRSKMLSELNAYKKWLEDKGIAVEVKKLSNVDNSQSLNLRYVLEWDVNSTQAENAVTGIEKEIDDLKKRIEAKWKTVNPVVSAYLQSDYLYNDLDPIMQQIADTMVRGLDYNQLGLVDSNGEKTAENIRNYITKYIINPLYTANDSIGSEISEALENLTSGAIDPKEFSQRVKEAFDTLRTTMDPKELNDFVGAFVSGYNAIEVSGQTFDDVVNNIVRDWVSLNQITSDPQNIMPSEQLTESITKLNTAYDILKKAQEEMTQGGVSADTISQMAKEVDNYLDYLYEENGVVRLNVEAWKEWADTRYEAVMKEVGSEELLNIYRALYSEATKAAEVTGSLINTLTRIQQAKSGLEALDKIYLDVVNGGNFDYLSLIDSKFIDAFSGYKEEFNAFMATIQQSPNDIEACQNAFNQLANAYIHGSGVLDDLNAETAAATVKMLEQIGVANAAELVDAQLTHDKEKLAYATGVCADMTYTEITALYNEVEAGSLAQQVIAEIAVEKEAVNAAHINTSDDIDQLIALANTAQATAAYLGELEYAKEAFRKADRYQEMYDNATSEESKARLARLIEEYRNMGKARIRLATPEFDAIDADQFKVEFTGGDNTRQYYEKQAQEAEKATETAAENAKTWFDIQLAEHKHRVQMEQETEAQYLAWLDKAYKQAYAEGILDLDEYRKYEEEVYDGRQKLAENAQSALDKLVDYRKKMLEQEVSDQKDALKEQLDALKDFYDKQKEMLQDSFDEEDYLRDQEEKRKSVTDIELKLAQIRGDDSAAAAKRRAELNQQLKEAKEELADFERDHARDAATKLLDDEYAKQEEAINAQIDSLDEKYKSAKELYEEALRDIKSGSVSLYQEMIAWNAEYGDGIDDTITSAWENAYKALQDYKTLYGSMFGGANLANATGYRYPAGGGYASGTSWAIPGLHRIDEDRAGSETIFESSNGRKYKMFSGGEKVLNARASDFLYRFANGGSQLLEKFVKRVTGGVPEGIGARLQTNAIEMGDIIIQGNADRETVSQIRREQRKAVDFMLKEINSLNY